MQAGILSKKIYQLYKEGEDETLRNLVATTLRDYREATLSELEELMPGIDGKLRLKLLELLMEDGSEDLIPLFIHTLLIEKNSLYAKSMMLVYGNFQHQSALSSLMEIENEMGPDLKTTFQRVTGKFRGKYREQFYMSEFASGINRRLKFASDLMVKEPHPSYLPFLNKQLFSDHPECRFEAIRVLEEIGDNTSCESLFHLMTTILKQRRLQEVFAGFVMSVMKGDQQAGHISKALAEAMEFTVDTLESLFQRAKSGKKEPFIAAVMDGYHFKSHPVMSVESERFIKQIVLAVPLGNSDFRKVKEALNVYVDWLGELLRTCLKAIGLIAMRHDVGDLLNRIDEVIPADEPNREALMIQVLKGFRTPKSFDLFIQYLNESKDPAIITEVLEGLKDFQSDDLPAVVRQLTLNQKYPELRRGALHVAGAWGFGGEVMVQLLAHPEQIIRIDAVHMIRDYKPEGGQDALIGMLQERLQGSLLLEVIRALGAFANERTGEVLTTYLSPSNAYDVRQTTMQVMVRTGSPEVFDALINGVGRYDAGKLVEVLDTFFGVLQNTDVDMYEAGLYRHPFFLEKLINHANNKIRDRILAILEKCSWKLEDYAAWVDLFKRAVTALGEERGAAEEKRVKGLLVSLEEKKQSAVKCGRAHKMFTDIITAWRGDDPYGKTQAMRRLSMGYKPEMVQDPEEENALLEMVCDGMKGGDELLALALPAALKINHPKLARSAEKYVNHDTVQLAKMARELVLNHAEPPEGPVRSVFIIDDSRYMTKQLSTVLLKAGYRVTSENHVKEGLMALSQGGFDLMILDLEMPEMDGARFLQTARNANMAPDLVLVIASTRDREHLSGVIEQGVEGLFLKPFPMGELLDKIKTLEAA